MRSIVIYTIIFGGPLLFYCLWLKFLVGKLDFILLLPVIVCAVWMALWPANYLPAWEKAMQQPAGDSADPIMVGFLLTGWIYGVIGSLPIIVFHAIRSFFRCGAKRRKAAAPAAETADP